MFPRMFLCLCVHVSVFPCVHVHALFVSDCVHAIYVCLYVCMYLCIDPFIHICVHVCMQCNAMQCNVV